MQTDNYYLVRANALESNVVPYKVVGGKRTVQDSSFSAAGKVGVWTKGDSMTHFDNLSVTVLK